MNWSEFFHMGGYAFFVWGSYGVFALAIVVEILLLWLSKRSLLSKMCETKNEVLHDD